MTKARPSKLDPHADKLSGWFRDEKITYAEAVTRLKDLGLDTNTSALHRWWQRHEQERLNYEILTSVVSGSKLSADLDRKFARNPAPELDTITKLLKTIVLHLSIHGKEEPGILKVALNALDRVYDFHTAQRDDAKLAQAEAQLAMDREKLELLKHKAAQADQAREVVASTLTPEEQRARLKEILK